MVVSWRNLTVELVDELYRAREELSKAGRPENGPNGPVSWQGYLDDIGLAKRTVNRWLERYEPAERRIMEPAEVEERKRIADRAAQDAAVAQRKRVIEAITTGAKPGDWDDATEKAFQKELKERKRTDERIAAAREKAEALQAKREQEAKRREEERASWARTDELLREAADRMVERHEKKQQFKARIRLSQAGETDQFIEALMEYLDELPDDNRRIESCQNIIKVCRNIAAQLQREPA